MQDRQKERKNAEFVKGYSFSNEEFGSNEIVKRRSDGRRERLRIVESLSEYITFIDGLCRKTGDRIYYHGLGNANYLPYASAFRYPIKDEDRNFLEFERRNPELICRTKNTVEKLLEMQHYELPTRMFDLSCNPLVGLFFACEDFGGFGCAGTHGDVYGQVMIFVNNASGNKDDFEKLNSEGQTVSIMANIAKMSEVFAYKKLEVEFMNDGHAGSLHDYMNLKHILKHSMIVCTPHINERIKNQDGAFLLSSACEIVDINDDSGACPCSIGYKFNLPELKQEILQMRYPLMYYVHSGFEMLENEKDICFLFGKMDFSGDNVRKLRDDPFDMNRFLYTDNNEVVSVIVPPTAKKEIMKSLANCGITLDFIYPEYNMKAKCIREKWRDAGEIL